MTSAARLLAPLALLAALAVPALLSAGCGGIEQPGGGGGISSASSPALAQLRRARALHQEAVRQAAAGDVDAAVRSLEEVSTLPFPPGAPEAADVAVDALAEVSRVLLSANRPVPAEAAARRAIARGPAPSYFVGLAWLRLGDALHARGQKREAVLAFERSIAVNNAVLRPGDGRLPESP
jgi:tetratricopeptide (TPR) repeat protein